MANVDAPRGARYVGSLSGTANPVIREYTHDVSDANPIFPGDFVTLEADGNIAPSNAADVILGVAMYVKVDMDVAATEHPGYSPASTAAVVGVCVDPFALYAIQTDGTLALTDIGNNGEIVATNGSTTTGRSAHELSSTMAGATAQLRVVGLSPVEGNDVSTANSEWLVMINEHALRTEAGV